MQFIQAILSNIWAFGLAVFFLGASIFVHELGHFLAARRRGMKVERFSIGFGPKIFGWRGRDGIEYRLSWIPLGGYVALPQLADMAAIEGESSVAVEKLPPVSYTTKVIVAAAGAFFNVLFALVLATIVWVVGQRMLVEEQTNRVGSVRPIIEATGGKTEPGPAFVAGIKPGDAILAVDGKKVSSLSDISYLIALGSGRGAQGEPKATLSVQRDGRVFDVDVYPHYVTADEIRDIGIEPSMQVTVAQVSPGSAAAAAGLLEGDIITHLDGEPVQYESFIRDYIALHKGSALRITYLRDGKESETTAEPRRLVEAAGGEPVYRLGVALRGAYSTHIAHIPPWAQFNNIVTLTWRNLSSLVNPRSDIGLDKMTGPIGIVNQIRVIAKYDFVSVLSFIVLINISLAIFNLLPIPVLDGGHILFATIAKLRGRALPARFIAATQSVFMLLLLTMIVYVSISDGRRIVRDNRAAAREAPAAPPEK
ncbi:RIP metalloprotease RseP [Termitidicoccus mucosus]|uniref:Zinc metalloprotease n=1 Tax=Termitidicoccus mucosus TaxID=1184151 RepID=A0A178INN3_9BACT|nr:hypothetical protein AW736_03005 [Opitutaceae bacterium TSB47]